MRPPDDSAKGFSTLEATIALAIVGGLAAVAYGSLSAWLQRSIEGEEDLRAGKVAESIAARVGLDLPARPALYQGESGGHRWRATIARTSETGASPFLLGLDIEVSQAPVQRRTFKVATQIVVEAPR